MSEETKQMTHDPEIEQEARWILRYLERLDSREPANIRRSELLVLLRELATLRRGAAKPFDDANLRAIEERAAKATKGPWVYRNDNRGNVVLNTAGAPVISVYSGKDDSGHVNITYSDLDFFTNAREDIPYLLAALRSRGGEGDAK